MCALALCAASGAQSAEACQPAGCTSAIRVGGAPPANLGGLVFAPGFRQPWDPERAPAFVLVDATTGSTVATEVAALPGGRYLARLAGELIPGREYAARSDAACESWWLPSRTFRAAAVAAPPRALGTLRVEWSRVGLWDTDLLENNGADPDGCRQRESWVAVASVRLDVAPEVEPWVDALEIETVIDGVVQADPTPGAIWSGPGKEFGLNRFGFDAAPVWLPCGSDGRAAGTREVRMRAWSEALGVSVETPPLVVALSCADSADEPESPTLDEAAPSCGCAATDAGRQGVVMALTLLALLTLRARRTPT